MARKDKRLGRGLSSLIADYKVVRGVKESPDTSADIASSAASQDNRPSAISDQGSAEAVPIRGTRAVVDDAVQARMVQVDELRPNPHQPRAKIDEESIKSLTRSIGASGMIQPIVVRESAEGLQIVAGERRWLAAKAAGLRSVPVVVRQASDEQMLEWALVENIHREDLNAVDRARAYRRYCEAFDLTAEEVGNRLGENRTTVTNYVRLLELPEDVQALLAANQISMGHARSLLGVPGDSRKIELASQVAAKGMSVRALEDLVRGERPKRGRDGFSQDTPRGLDRDKDGPPEAHIRDLERRFEEVFGTKVRIRLGRSRGSGRIVVEFCSVDDFERICRTVGVSGEEKQEGM